MDDIKKDVSVNSDGERQLRLEALKIAYDLSVKTKIFKESYSFDSLDSSKASKKFREDFATVFKLADQCLRYVNNDHRLVEE